MSSQPVHHASLFVGLPTTLSPWPWAVVVLPRLVEQEAQAGRLAMLEADEQQAIEVGARQQVLRLCQSLGRARA